MGIASKTPEEWQSCESGYLVALSMRAKTSRQRRFALQVGTGVAVLVFAVGVGLWSSGFWRAPGEDYFGDIACHEVHENMPAMMAGTLPADLRARIEAHLKECPACREMMQKMQAGQAAASVSHDYWTCECPECQGRLAQAVSRVLHSKEPEQTVVAVSFPLP